jgi:C1A family cysteine protease
MEKLSRYSLVISMAAAASTLFAGCAPGAGNSSKDETPDDTSTYPSIDPNARSIQAGPVLATPNNTARKQRLDYHQKVIDAHKLSYTISEVAPSHLDLKHITGYKPTNKNKGKPAPKKKNVSVPTKWDWRGQGVPAIRDQGQCGSCWAFGTTAVVESAIGIFGKQSVNLSEQFVVDCNQNQFSCDGGDWSFEMFQKPEGGVLENDYPYTAYDGNCYGSKVAHPFLIDSFNVLDSPGVDAIKNTIYTYGAVGVSMSVCGSFPGYSGGVYDSSECDYADRNHIVSLVGWDDTVSHSKGKGAWILRNSWGDSWGDNGYAKIAYNTAGIGADVSYVVYNGSGGGGSSSASSGASSGSSGAGGGSSSSGAGGAGGSSSVGVGVGVGSGGVGGGCSSGVGTSGAGGGNGGGCAHSPCKKGAALDQSCDSAVGDLCWADDYCCSTEWDGICVYEYGYYGSCP